MYGSLIFSPSIKIVPLVRQAVELGADVVDLYYYHRPDGVTPLGETLGAMRPLPFSII